MDVWMNGWKVGLQTYERSIVPLGGKPRAVRQNLSTLQRQREHQ